MNGLKQAIDDLIVAMHDGTQLHRQTGFIVLHEKLQTMYLKGMIDQIQYKEMIYKADQMCQQTNLH